MILKSQGRQFLRELLQHVFINSQTATPLIDASQIGEMRNRAGIEEIFTRAARMENLATGLVFFMRGTFAQDSYEGEKLAKFIKWASKIALDTLRTGVDVIPIL
jgi:nucleolar MIF4G domain-containing protein 1